ncbi:LysR family transcriptional regulator [Arthrobacter luteolus]|uniref:LysR family transcriptional regulator n=1 Tax=Arthrobacter luteolus TaxID=98672 RepID=UPI000ADDB8BF|nr:LysR substrate-binding domain-containing protein [Arthrobacter luteolus]
MDLTIHHLRCFLAVARELHFGRAASQLHLSPSALSEQISNLEGRLNHPLFHRSSRTVELTDYGQRLLPLAQEAAAAMDKVLEWGEKAAEEAHLRVGLMVSSTGFRTIMSAAAQHMPRVQWDIRQLGFLHCFDALEKNEVDCAFIIDLGLELPPHFRSVPLWQEPCVLVASEQHPLAGRETVKLADLTEETFITVRDAEASTRWFGALDAVGGAPRMLAAARNFEEVLELCSAGLGVNIAGSAAADTYDRPGLRFIPIEDAPPATTTLFLRSGKTSPALDQFIGLATALANS